MIQRNIVVKLINLPFYYVEQLEKVLDKVL